MPKTTLNAVLLAAMSALVPSFAHATLLTTTDTTRFDVSDAVSDKLGGGSSSSVPNKNMDTEKKAAIALFDKNKGVLTGAAINLVSTYKQTVVVNVAKGDTTANTQGDFKATGKGSGSVALGIPTDVIGASAALGPIDASCSGSKIKSACNGTAKWDHVDQNTAVGSGSLNAYVGNGSGSFLADLLAVSNTAETTSNTFDGQATTTSTINWDGTLSATYSYLRHAAQSFDANAAVNELTLDFGDVVLGTKVKAKAFSIANLGDADRVGLKLTNVAETDANDVFSTSLSLFDNLAQGGSNGYTASFLASVLGQNTATYKLTLADANPDVAFASDSLGKGYNLTLYVKANVVKGTAAPAGAGQVPEPASLMLLGLGAAGLAAARKRRQS